MRKLTLAKLLIMLAAVALIVSPAGAGKTPKWNSDRAAAMTYSEADQIVVTSTNFAQAVTDRTTTKFYDTASDAKAIRSLLVQCPTCSTTAVVKITLSQTRTGDAAVKSAATIAQGGYMVAEGKGGREWKGTYFRSTLGTSIWVECTDPSVVINLTVGVADKTVE